MVLIFYFLLQTASNTAQGPYQGLMPDVVPVEQRGTASGYFGVANVVGLLAGTVGAGYILAHAGRSAAILSICALLVVTMLATILSDPGPRGADRGPVHAASARPSPRRSRARCAIRAFCG